VLVRAIVTLLCASYQLAGVPEYVQLLAQQQLQALQLLRLLALLLLLLLLLVLQVLV
jgi:hypothetical protein